MHGIDWRELGWALEVELEQAAGVPGIEEEVRGQRVQELGGGGSKAQELSER